MEAPEPGKQELINGDFSIVFFPLQNLFMWILYPWNLANGVRLCLQRALETFTIILAATQLLCVGSLHAGTNAAIVGTPMGMRNRV